MSLFLNDAGKDCFSTRQQVAKMELLTYKKSGVIDKVQILTCGKNSCEACQQLDRKVFTIEEALEKMPIPCKECTFILYDKTRGFCRCAYLPGVDL
jgi:thioredoxin-related protein